LRPFETVTHAAREPEVRFFVASASGFRDDVIDL
jgi:hypothetical protein